MTTPQPRRTVDRFGFVVGDTGGNRQASGAPSYWAVWQERKRESKWRRMLDHWEAFRTKEPAVLKRRIRKGIPNSVRSRAWWTLSGAAEHRDQAGVTYAQLLAQVETIFDPQTTVTAESLRRPREHAHTRAHPYHIWDSVIAVDLERTFPNHTLFRIAAESSEAEARTSARTLSALQRILRAYGVHNPTVGYTQGMNFLAGMFLTYMREEQAFWILAKVMDSGDMYHLQDLYKPSTPLVPIVWFVMERLLQRCVPKVGRHFEAHGVLSSMYLTEWCVTMYTRSFPFSFVVRVWDIFLHEGWKIFYRIALALLHKHQRSLLAMDLEGIMDFFRKIPGECQGDAGNFLIAYGKEKIRITNKQIRDLVAQAGADGENGEKARKKI